MRRLEFPPFFSGEKASEAEWSLLAAAEGHLAEVKKKSKDSSSVWCW